MKFFVLFLILAQVGVAPAAQDNGTEILSSYGARFDGSRIDLNTFLAPNEKNPGWVRTFAKKAPVGAYVSVGTERGFMSASMLPQINLLVLVDVNEGAVIFNRINTLLLKIASSRSDYRRLRLSAGLEEWKLAASTFKLDERERDLFNSKYYNWWNIFVRINGGFKIFNQNPRLSFDFHAPFRGANYLFYDRLFDKIQSLARANRIWPINLNLANIGELTNVMNRIRSAGEVVSVWDESNVGEYINGREQLVDAISPYTKPNSVHLYTVFENLLDLVDRKTFKKNGPWYVYAHTFNFLSENKLTHKEGLLVDGSKKCMDLLNSDFRNRAVARPTPSR